MTERRLGVTMDRKQINRLANVAEAIGRSGKTRKAKLAAKLGVSPEFVDFLLWNLIIMYFVMVFLIGG